MQRDTKRERKAEEEGSYEQKGGEEGTLIGEVKKEEIRGNRS